MMPKTEMSAHAREDSALGRAIDALVRFSSECNFEALPASVVREAKNRLLDTVGCMLGGVSSSSSAMVREMVGSWGGRPESVVVGTPWQAPAAWAAFCNGAAGHAIELDDDHKQAILHPGVCVVPAALAVAEKTKASGQRLLTAIVVGYEVMCRIGEAAGPARVLEKGFHPTGICGAFGAAAAAAHLQAFSVDQLRAALGIAGSFASGLFEFVSDGSLVKRLHPANAAKSGIVAAELAARGYSGPASVLDGRFGFFSAFTGGVMLGPLLRELGTEFEIARTSYKQHACCSYCHPLMDALMQILEAARPDPDDVEEIVGRTFREAIRIVGEPQEKKQEPANSVAAQFSAPYCLAVMLCDGRAMPKQFAPTRVGETRVRALTRRIRIEAGAEFDRDFPHSYPAELVVRLRDGRTLEARVQTSKGDPSWPLSQEELNRKFSILAADVMPSRQIEAVQEAIDQLDRAGDVRELVARLAVS